MPLSHEHIGSKILAKIRIYILTRAELLCRLCYEIPCTYLCWRKVGGSEKVKKKWWRNIGMVPYGTHETFLFFIVNVWHVRFADSVFTRKLSVDFSTSIFRVFSCTSKLDFQLGRYFCNSLQMQWHYLFRAEPKNRITTK